MGTQANGVRTLLDKGHVFMRGVEHGGSELSLVHMGMKITHPHTTAQSVRSLVDHDHPGDVYDLEVTV